MVQLISLTEEELQNLVAKTIRQELEDFTPKPVTKEPTKFNTRKETADRLHISLPTLNEYTKKGIITGQRIGSRVLYSEEAIQEALKFMYS